jgi:hypothetical protein
VPSKPNNGGAKSDTALLVDGQKIHLPEWSLLRSAPNTVQKLILVWRFREKLDRVWGRIGDQKAKHGLHRKYSDACAILYCAQTCCGNDLTWFYEKWGARFAHCRFSTDSCSAWRYPFNGCGYRPPPPQ